MKLPELTLGVSFAPKFQRCLILPATKHNEKTKFSSSGFAHSIPRAYARGLL